MPRYQRKRPVGWFCNGCGAFYQEKEYAVACEARHQALSDYAEGRITELDLAAALGLDVSTPRARDGAIASVRNMFPSGSDGDSLSRQAPFSEAVGTQLGITAVHSDGRVQIPHRIRRRFKIEDGMLIYWYVKGGQILLNIEQIETSYQGGKMSQRDR